MKRKLNLLITVAITLPVLAHAYGCGIVRMCGPAVQSNTFVGTTEAQLKNDYGPPEKDWQGYLSLAHVVPPSLPEGKIRTLIFQPHGLFHPKGGTLWVWVVERDGQWICFESCWFADGVKF